MLHGLPLTALTPQWRVSPAHPLCQTLKNARCHRAARARKFRKWLLLINSSIHTAQWGCTAALRWNKSLSSSSRGQIGVITLEVITTSNINYPAWSRTCAESQTAEAQIIREGEPTLSLQTFSSGLLQLNRQNNLHQLYFWWTLCTVEHQNDAQMWDFSALCATQMHGKSEPFPWGFI